MSKKKVTDEMVILAIIGFLGAATEEEITGLFDRMKRALEAAYNHSSKRTTKPSNAARETPKGFLEGFTPEELASAGIV